MPHLALKNPHSILAALETRPQDVFEVRVERQAGGDLWSRIAGIAAARGVAVREAPAADRRAISKGDKAGRHGGAEALVRERQGIELDQMFAPEPGHDRGLWLGLDQLQDPHNVGAIFRTAAFFGVRGIVLTRDRSAPLSAAAYDVASGGLEYVPFSLQTNLVRTIEFAKQQGLWVLGASEHAAADAGAIDRDRRWLLLVGNEERGLRRLSLDSCDELCRIAPRGPVGSLNASVAAGVMMATLTSAASPAPAPVTTAATDPADRPPADPG